MADIVPTQVVLQGGVLTAQGIAGEALAVGDSAYRSATDNEWYELDVDDAVQMSDISELDRSLGIVVTAAADGAPVIIATWGPVNLGAVLTVTAPVYGSGTSGGLKPAADLISGDVPVIMGSSLSTSILYLHPANSGTALA